MPYTTRRILRRAWRLGTGQNLCAEQLLLYANPHRSQPPFYPRWGVDPDELSEDEWDEYDDDDDDESEYEDESVCATRAFLRKRQLWRGCGESLWSRGEEKMVCLKFILRDLLSKTT